MTDFYEDNTDNEYDSEYDSEEESETIYEPEEPSETKYNIVVCEKYNRLLHGPADKIMENQYLTYARFKKLNMNIIRSFYSESNRFRIEIAQCVYLPSEHCVSIIKTFWLKLIQKKWKKICKERKLCIERRTTLNAIRYKEIYGKWPNNCLNYPNLKGMLSNLYTSRRTPSSVFRSPSI